jgi:ribonuclease HI
MAAPTNKKKY